MNRELLKALTLVVMTLAPAALLFPQTLAEAAKKEQARRKKTAPVGAPKVYTESDLPASPTAGAPSDADGEMDAEKPSAAPTAPTVAAQRAMKGAASAAETREREALALEARRTHLKERIARADEVVQRLAKHPTGGGRVCRVPEGVFVPGETAPSQVVCPYQMETRYEVAKRTLDKLNADLAALENAAGRRGRS